MFPGCAVAPLGGMGDMPVKGKPGRTREHDCDADRKRASRDQFRAELQMALDLVAGGDHAARHCSPAVAELRQQMSEFGHGKDTILSTIGHDDLVEIGGTVFASIFGASRWTSILWMTSSRLLPGCVGGISSHTSGKRRMGCSRRASSIDRCQRIPAVGWQTFAPSRAFGWTTMVVAWPTRSLLGCSLGSAW